MTLPGEWLTAALVGVGRVPLPGGGGLPPALAELRTALDGRPPADVLLLLAGAAALYDDAGRLPPRAPATEWYLPALGAAGDRPPCSPAAARHLERMIDGQSGDLLPELLALLDAAGQRLADESLPHALAYGARAPKGRLLLLPVLGERGRWLGAINPAWRYAAVELDNWPSLRAAWQHDPAGRAALAQTVRRRDPAAARRLIETTWRGDSAIARRDYLAVLETGLSADDEPFLERALDDRDAPVRQKAVALLAALPDSRLVGRVTLAFGDVLTLSGGHLSPRFPAAVSDAMARDGVTRPIAGLQTPTERSRLLMQTVGVIPPAHWEERLRATPEALVRAAAAGRWPRTLLGALAAATGRHPDPRWLRAILDHDGLHERTAALVPRLSPDEARARLAAAVAAGDTVAVIVLLRRWTGGWDEGGARLALAFLAAEAASEHGHPAATPGATAALGQAATLRFLMRAFARHCPPALAGEAAALFAAHPPTAAWQPTIRLFLSTLALRRELHEAVRMKDEV